MSEIETKLYDNTQYKYLKNFTYECKLLNLNNNDEIKKYKLGIVDYFCLYDKNRMIGISGISNKTEACLEYGDYQIHYRLAVFPEYISYYKPLPYIGATSLAWRILQTECLLEAKRRGAKRFLYTTNDNASSSMKKHSSFGSSKGFAEIIGEKNIYGVEQVIWSINFDKHFENLDNIVKREKANESRKNS